MGRSHLAVKEAPIKPPLSRTRETLRQQLNPKKALRNKTRQTAIKEQIPRSRSRILNRQLAT
jgi:hypothetical protein